jgi:purine-binding chemotaxis protein CheW
VINLRGKIIPILDLRTKFGLAEQEYNETTVFIIVDINGKSGVYNIGITVDAVHEVLDIDKEQVEQTPRLGLKLKSQYLLGIARLREEMAMILNLDMIITADEIIALTE